MKFTQLEIRVVGNEIAITQENFDEDMGVSGDEIRITLEMVDLVCNELQILKRNLEADAQERK